MQARAIGKIVTPSILKNNKENGGRKGVVDSKVERIIWLCRVSDTNGISSIYRGLVAAGNVGLRPRKAVRAKGTIGGVQTKAMVWPCEKTQIPGNEGNIGEGPCEESLYLRFAESKLKETMRSRQQQYRKSHECNSR